MTVGTCAREAGETLAMDTMMHAYKLRERYAEQPFLMAPMAGVTDAAYRIMCRRRGAQTCFTEMVSVAGLAYDSAKTWVLVDPEPEEPQICVQFFGSKPEQFARAVASVQERLGERLTLIDVNMACPARKVIKKCEGSALMDAPDRAEAIIRACVAEAQVPVTAKIRIGFKRGERNAASFAAMLEQAGASAVAVHGRTADQLYTGKADWMAIDEVASAVSIPVIGSGDVFSAEDAARMLATTAASAVFVARGTYGNPWVFDDARALWRGEISSVTERSAAEKLSALREHLTLLHETQPFMARARTFGGWYLKGLPHATAWRRELVQCTEFDEYLALLDRIEVDVAACEQLLVAGQPIPTTVL